LIVSAVVCILPFVNLLALSFSNSAAVAAGNVKFWPVGFTVKSYIYVTRSQAFLRSIFVSLQRVALGVSINMLLTVITAYPLSKSSYTFKPRSVYAWFFMVTMLFSASVIPWFMVIKFAGLIDTIWALVIPGALPVFNMIVLLNFFRGLPNELEEAAFIDGAGHWTILWNIFVPLSKPALATVCLFCILNHWNSWFDGLILMNSPKHYPLQSYLQTIIINPAAFFNSMKGSSDYNLILQYVNSRTAKTAQLFIAAVPILIAYPFLQRYFTTGLVLGSVKG
jgi:putative aldouronate transport system permease protein